jgi:threonine dehydrogenase-like Zn-dependent dehydrogenase
MQEFINSRQWESRLDGISNLKLTSTSIPLPGPGEVLVKINAVSLNYKDGETIEGLFNHHKAIEMPQTIVPCGDAAGEISQMGEGVTKWKKGDRVLSLPYPDYLTGKVTQEMLKSSIGSSGKGELSLGVESKCSTCQAYFASTAYSEKTHFSPPQRVSPTKRHAHYKSPGPPLGWP